VGVIDCVWEAGAALGEGPHWSARERALYWVDIERPRVLRLCTATGERAAFPVPEEIGCLVPRRGGGFVAGLRSGLAFVDLTEDGLEVRPILAPEPDLPGNRLNDGKCDAEGRLWVGTMDDACERPTGALYRLDPDLRLSRMDGGYAVTNGPAFSPDGTVLYHNDSMARTILAFDCDPSTGEIANRRVFARLADGFPDGMTVDAEGGLWCAVWGGARVLRLLPDGSIDRVLELPVRQVTSCAFGGDDLRTLYVTTAAIRLSPDELRDQPLAGGLFAWRAEVPGLPAAEFAG
jgi:sugar lactone lactonase YvrE